MAAVALLEPATIRIAFPNETLGMGDPELSEKLRMLEFALRADFAVSRTDAAASAGLALGMSIAFVSFLHRLQNVKSVTAGVDSYREDRGAAVDDAWPPVVLSVLLPYSDAASPQLYTDLVR